jgi:beta-mannosidase
MTTPRLLLISLSTLLLVCWGLRVPIAVKDNDADKVIPDWQSILTDSDRTSVIHLFGPLGTSWSLHSSADDGTNKHDEYEIKSSAVVVPGDILSDLMRAHLIGDPYYDRNFLTERRIWMGDLVSVSTDTATFTATNANRTTASIQKQLEQRTRTWIYSTHFFLPDYSNSSKTSKAFMLVVEGVKMGASIALNGVLIGNVTNQFRRYTLQLPEEALAKGKHFCDSRHHNFTVTFDPSIATDGRFMACSGGWDWAPYSQAGDERGSRVFTFGIVQPLYIATVDSVFITDMAPKIYYLGPYPQSPLWDGPADDFVVHVDVYVRCVVDTTEAQTHSFILARSTFSNETFRIPLPKLRAGDEQTISFNMTASKESIKLWWPNGLGEQPLYMLELAIKHDNESDGQLRWMQKRIGFRVASLVTVNDADVDVVEDLMEHPREGSGKHGMYFRINGALLWSRGANVVPMDQLEGRLTDEGHRLLVQSAATANMNMLRVWGGGAILPKSFYDACDEFGILLYHDLMFVGEQNHGAVRSHDVKDEIIQLVRKLSAHPSIVLWSGCNECTYGGGSMDIYESFVMQTVAYEDDTRAVWPSSPSAFGWKTGVCTLDGRPNGNPLQVQNDTGRTLETHGPYQRGYSATYPGVNSMLTANTYETHIPPIFREHDTGPMFRNVFVSEFGASVSSSFESMSALLPENSWSLHGGSPADSCGQLIGQVNVCNGTNSMAERNYPCDNRIQAFFGNVSLDSVGRRNLEQQLFQCMMAQTLWMKGQIEIMRSSNTFGTLIWQLNENWPTGGWGTIEYGPSRILKGQLVGGRWKPLMYLLRQSLFRDVFAACGKDDRCYVRNDGVHPVDASVWLEAWNLRESKAMRAISRSIRLDGGCHSTQRFSLPPSFLENADVVLIGIEDSHTGISLIEPTAFLENPPRSIPRLSNEVNITIQVNELGNGAALHLSTDRLVLYLFVSTEAEGRFSDNAFHLRPYEHKTIVFDPLTSNDVVDTELLEKTLRIEHLGTFVVRSLSDIEYTGTTDHLR